MSGDDRGYNLAQYLQAEQERMASQPLKGGCEPCGLEWEGTVEEVLKLSLEHRQESHPETLKARRRKSVRTLSSFRSQRMDDESKDEIEQERQKRAFLIGIDLRERPQP